jgi:hypothetical protein
VGNQGRRVALEATAQPNCRGEEQYKQAQKQNYQAGRDKHRISPLRVLCEIRSSACEETVNLPSLRPIHQVKSLTAHANSELLVGSTSEPASKTATNRFDNGFDRLQFHPGRFTMPGNHTCRVIRSLPPVGAG